VLDAIGMDSTAGVRPAPGGASGSAWFVGSGADRGVLRIDGSAVRTDACIAAMAAAREAGLPAPALIRRAEIGGRVALLLTYLEGGPVLDLLQRTPRAASAWAFRMGALQRRLHAVVAPPAVLAVTDPAAAPFWLSDVDEQLGAGDSLLHFDWHPGNLLADEASGEISGIVDWDNARRGHAALDLARTESMLTVEPFIAALDTAGRRVIDDVRRAWAEGYGPEAFQIPPAARAWAGRVMIDDLAERYRGAPEALDSARAWAEGRFA
jgi:aminoglycoside phosphotransferase (APT) family kinase protein